MPILSVGKTNLQGRDRKGAVAPSAFPARRGVTLIELLVVVAIISLMVGLSFPAITSGIDTLRLNAATNGVVGFINGALNRAERRQQVVEITISRAENALSMRSTEAGFGRRLEIPEGVSITHVLPEMPGNPDAPRTFLLYPGGTVPRFGVQLINRRNVERIVRVDPITGVPRVEQPEQ
jgi:prepilin-type N-terminal cleavage/methylation domain-containing protein